MSLVIDSFNTKNGVLYNFTKKTLVASEYFPNTICKNLNQDKLFAEIKGDLVSIYNAKTNEFSIKNCINSLD